MLTVGGRSIQVKIPRAVASGARLRVPSAATGDGDVLIRLTVKPHRLFRRRGEGKAMDLELDLPLTIAEAIFGARVEVPTLEGAVHLTVPPGAGRGKPLRVKGHGLDDGVVTGDLYVYPRVIAPKAEDLPKKLRDALEKEEFPSPRTGPEWP
jgi:DnaJ-class molecular chaperone